MIEKPKDKRGRRITEKTRAALAESRRRARENSVARATVGVFVTRLTGGRLFRWEIRQFGGILLESGQEGFATSAKAQAAGERVLADRTSAISDERTS